MGVLLQGAPLQQRTQMAGEGGGGAAAGGGLLAAAAVLLVAWTNQSLTGLIFLLAFCAWGAYCLPSVAHPRGQALERAVWAAVSGAACFRVGGRAGGRWWSPRALGHGLSSVQALCPCLIPRHLPHAPPANHLPPHSCVCP